MLPGASYGNVCVRVRRTHTAERPRLDGKEKRFEREIVCFHRDSASSLRTADIMQREDSAKSRHHRVSNTIIIMYLKRHIYFRKFALSKSESVHSH